VRRLIAAILAVGLLVLPLSASAHQSENYKDKLTSISWGGSDGSLLWPGPWTEINDDGDEKKGNVRVVSSGNCKSGNCIWIGAVTTLLGSIGARRSADTSDFDELFLRFDLCATASLLASELVVQVRGGGGWTTVAEYQLGSELSVSPTIDISEFRSEDFQIRFLFSGVLLSSEVYIDNIEIYGSTMEQTTTTTTAPTTTSTSTTTTTTAPTTTTTAPATTTTSAPAATTTTKPAPAGTKPGDDGGFDTDTATTTSVPSRTSIDPGAAGGPPSSTSSTSTTTTVPAGAGGGEEGGDGGGASQGGGLRLATRGLQANFQGDLYGEVRGVTYLNGVDFQADYNMAVEIIEASWGWIVLLGMVVAYSILSGLDRRRRRADP
jgi:hypothetical protein